VASRPRRPGSDRGRAAIDWEAAFSFFASLPPGQRRYSLVAAEFDVALRTVERHGRDGSWRARAAEIDAQARSEVDARLGRARANQLADVEKLIEASFVTYAQQLRDGEVRISAAGFATLVKLLQQLAGQPGEPAPETTTRPDSTAVRSPERTQAVIDALRETGALEVLGLHATVDPDDNGPEDTNDTDDEKEER
jgi:hypothetical protein